MLNIYYKLRPFGHHYRTFAVSVTAILYVGQCLHVIYCATSFLFPYRPDTRVHVFY